MQEKKKTGRGGYREGAGRKPFGEKAFETTIVARINQEEKETYKRLGGVQWLRDTLHEASQDRPKLSNFGFVPVTIRQSANVPMSDYSVQAGFPSPAEDYIDKGIDFNELLIENEPATIVIRTEGESMIDAGISPGDLLVVNRSREPKNQDIVIMQINNEFTVKRYVKENGTLYLKAENTSGQYTNIYPNEDDSWLCFGVVSAIIKQL